MISRFFGIYGKSPAAGTGMEAIRPSLAAAFRIDASVSHAVRAYGI